LDSSSSIGTELELAGPKLIPEVSIGYRRKLKSYEIQNSINTKGEIQTLFSYIHS
jgi:hypothetical protein